MSSSLLRCSTCNSIRVLRDTTQVTATFTSQKLRQIIERCKTMENTTTATDADKLDNVFKQLKRLNDNETFSAETINNWNKARKYVLNVLPKKKSAHRSPVLVSLHPRANICMLLSSAFQTLCYALPDR